MCAPAARGRATPQCGRVAGAPATAAMRASRAAAATALVVAAALVAAARAAAGGSSAGAFPDGAALAHPADVGELMAFAATGNGCTRWATRTGEVGCAGDALGALARLTGAGGATAAAEKAEAAARAAGTGVIAVVSAEEFFAAGGGSKGASASLVSMLADSGRGMEGVVGVLIEADSAASGAYSPAAAAPQGALAHEGQSASYVWNPAGDGALEMRLEVPVIQMTPHDTTEVLRRAAWNEHERAFEPPLYQASFSSDARTDGTSGTEDALGQRQCVPVGGHSIVAVTGGAEAQHATERSPVVLLAASMDARSFFYTQVDTGAGPRSGVVAMLAAADALARACAAVGKPGCPVEALGGARVAMAALDAEAWGHLGARSLGRALRGGAQLGLVEEDVHALLEVGSVGTSQTQAGGELFAHCSLSECSAATMASPAAAELLKALNETDVRDSSAPADAGFPPGVAMAMAHDDGHWLHRGAVLSGWDTRLPVNYMSQRDVLASYSEPDFKALVAKAATAAARGTCAAAAVAGGAGGEIDCKSLVADDAYVSALVDCLVAAHPGIQCELATNRVWGGNSATASRYSQQQSWPDAAPDMKRRGVRRGRAPLALPPRARDA